MQVNHHVKYKEIHGVDEIVIMDKGEHGRLHTRLRREGKCNIPPKELARISMKANMRGWHLFKVSEKNFNRLKTFGFAGESINTALGRVLNLVDKDKEKKD